MAASSVCRHPCLPSVLWAGLRPPEKRHDRPDGRDSQTDQQSPARPGSRQHVVHGAVHILVQVDRAPAQHAGSREDEGQHHEGRQPAQSLRPDGDQSDDHRQTDLRQGHEQQHSGEVVMRRDVVLVVQVGHDRAVGRVLHAHGRAEGQQHEREAHANSSLTHHEGDQRQQSDSRHRGGIRRLAARQSRQPIHLVLQGQGIGLLERTGRGPQRQTANVYLSAADSDTLGV